MLTSRTLELALRKSQRGRTPTGSLLRYLLLLLLPTPLLVGIRLVVGREAPPPEIQIVRQIVEVPQPVYVEVPVPTVVIVVPADALTVTLTAPTMSQSDAK